MLATTPQANQESPPELSIEAPTQHILTLTPNTPTIFTFKGNQQTVELLSNNTQVVRSIWPATGDFLRLNGASVKFLNNRYVDPTARLKITVLPQTMQSTAGKRIEINQITLKIETLNPVEQ